MESTRSDEAHIFGMSMDSYQNKDSTSLYSHVKVQRLDTRNIFPGWSPQRRVCSQGLVLISSPLSVTLLRRENGSSSSLIGFFG